MEKTFIKNLGKVITGNTPSKSNPEFYDSDDICFVKPDTINNEGITLINSTKEYISEKAKSKARVVSKGTVLVTCIGSIGKVGVVDTEELSFNQQINAIEPNQRVLSRYLAYNLLSNKQKLLDMANAPIVPIINKTQFENFEISIECNKEKQAKIIEILDKVSDMISLKKQQLAELDNLIKSQFVEMFGMPHEKRFETKTLSDITTSDKNSLKRGPFGGSLKKEDFVEKGYLVYEQRHAIHNDFEYEKYYITAEKYQEMIMFKVVPGDLLVSCSGVTLGRIAEVPQGAKEGIINQALLKISLNQELMSNMFFITLFRNEEIQDILFGFSRGSGIPNFPSMNEVKAVEFICPPIDLQNQFSSFVQQVDKLKFEIQKSLDETQTLFDSLMQQYFG